MEPNGEWRPPDDESYAYLLGMYLGDGCLTHPPRTVQLVIACDAQYPGIVDACADAVLSQRRSVALLDDIVGSKA